MVRFFFAVGEFVCGSCSEDSDCIHGASCTSGICTCEPGKVFTDDRCGPYSFVYIYMYLTVF